MSNKKLNAIKEIEFRINKAQKLCQGNRLNSNELSVVLDDIDSLLFDINDFINDLKDE